MLKAGVPYDDAIKMPVPFALALLNGGRQDNTNHARADESNGSKRRVATRRLKEAKQ